MKITIPNDSVKKILSMPNKDGFSRETRLAFGAIVLMGLNPEEHVPVVIQGKFKITDLPDGSIEAEYPFTKDETNINQGSVSYTCGKCGKPVFTESPKGDTSAIRLQATALYCVECDEIVCMGCGVQRMKGGGGCPCGICGGTARIIDANNHPSWYPGLRPSKTEVVPAPKANGTASKESESINTVCPLEHLSINDPNLPSILGFMDYEVYAADNLAEAKSFLESVVVTRTQYYIVVETPNGVMGRDINGIYEPSHDWRGKDLDQPGRAASTMFADIEHLEIADEVLAQWWPNCPPDFRKSTSSEESGMNDDVQTAPTKANCFVATACCGSSEAIEVKTLRRFRDELLLNRKSGRVFVYIYSRLSPPLATFISNRPKVSRMGRVLFIRPLARLAENALIRNLKLNKS